MDIEIHDTNVYENISLVLFINTSINLNMIKHNSLLFLKNVSDNFIKKINIKGFQYCLTTTTAPTTSTTISTTTPTTSTTAPTPTASASALTNIQNIPFNFILYDSEDSEVASLQGLKFKVKDENTIVCTECNNELYKLDVCSCTEVTINEFILHSRSVSPVTVAVAEQNYDKTPDKFQDSMARDAIRLYFAIKRENYKKHMKQISSIKSNTSNDSFNAKICKAITKKGIKCSNKCIKNQDYCGITSHKFQ